MLPPLKLDVPPGLRRSLVQARDPNFQHQVRERRTLPCYVIEEGKVSLGELTAKAFVGFTKVVRPPGRREGQKSSWRAV